MAERSTAPNSDNRPLTRPWGMLALAAAGALLSVISLRQAIPAILLIPVEASLDHIQQQLTPDPDRLKAIVGTEQNALLFIDDPTNLGNLGLALALQAAAQPLLPAVNPDPASDLRQRARLDLVQSLALAPSNPYNWARLTLLSQQAGDPLEKSLAYWRFSKLTGPNEDRLRVIRASLALPLWHLMDQSDREGLFEDIRHAFYDQTQSIVDIGMDPFGRAVIRSALLSDLSELKRFEAELIYRRDHGKPK